MSTRRASGGAASSGAVAPASASAPVQPAQPVSHPPRAPSQAAAASSWGGRLFKRASLGGSTGASGSGSRSSAGGSGASGSASEGGRRTRSVSADRDLAAVASASGSARGSGSTRRSSAGASARASASSPAPGQAHTATSASGSGSSSGASGFLSPVRSARGSGSTSGSGKPGGAASSSSPPRLIPAHPRLLKSRSAAHAEELLLRANAPPPPVPMHPLTHAQTHHAPSFADASPFAAASSGSRSAHATPPSAMVSPKQAGGSGSSSGSTPRRIGGSSGGAHSWASAAGSKLSDLAMLGSSPSKSRGLHHHQHQQKQHAFSHSNAHSDALSHGLAPPAPLLPPSAPVNAAASLSSASSFSSASASAAASTASRAPLSEPFYSATSIQAELAAAEGAAGAGAAAGVITSTAAADDLVLDLEGLDLGPYGVDLGMAGLSWRYPSIATHSAGPSSLSLPQVQKAQHQQQLGEDSFTQHLRDQCPPTLHDVFAPPSLRGGMQGHSRAGTDSTGAGGSAAATAADAGVASAGESAAPSIGRTASSSGYTSEHVHSSPRLVGIPPHSEPVLGGFASLGLSDPNIEDDALMFAREASLLPASAAAPLPNGAAGTERAPGISGDESAAAVAALQQQPLAARRPSQSASPWGFLVAQTSDPMETLDSLSIEDMGLHSIDIGSAEDWQGCILANSSPARTAPSWAVARHMKPRHQKWVVAPCCVRAPLDAAPAQQQPDYDSDTCGCGADCLPRTVIVTTQKAGAAAAAEDFDFTSDAAPKRNRNTAAALAEAHKSPFAGVRSFELRMLGLSAASVFVLSSADMPATAPVVGASAFDAYSLPPPAAPFDAHSPPTDAPSKQQQARTQVDLSAHLGALRRHDPTGPAVVAASAGSSRTFTHDPESRRPSLGKSVSHESVGVTPVGVTPRAHSIGGGACFAAQTMASRASLPNTPTRETAPRSLVVSPPSETDASSSAGAGPSLQLDAYAFPESSAPSSNASSPDGISPSVSPRMPHSPLLTDATGSPDASPLGSPHGRIQRLLDEPASSPHHLPVPLPLDGLSREARLREHSNQTQTSGSYDEETLQAHHDALADEPDVAVVPPLPASEGNTGLYGELSGISSLSASHLPAKKGKKEAKFKLWLRRRFMMGEDELPPVPHGHPLLPKQEEDVHGGSHRGSHGRGGHAHQGRGSSGSHFWSSTAMTTSSSKSMDDLSLMAMTNQRNAALAGRQHAALQPTQPQPLRHGRDFDEIRKAVLKSWGMQSASDAASKGAALPAPISRSGSQSGAFYSLKMLLPVPLESSLPGGPKKLRMVKVSFMPFASESTIQSPETTLDASQIKVNDTTPPKTNPHGIGQRDGDSPRWPTSPRRMPSNREAHEVCRIPSRNVTIDAFRISAQVLPAHEEAEDEDDGLPAPMSFPVVLAVCDARRNLELFPEGWEALGLGCGPVGKSPSPVEATARRDARTPSPLPHMFGVTDLIIAGCAAIMDL